MDDRAAGRLKPRPESSVAHDQEVGESVVRGHRRGRAVHRAAGPFVELNARVALLSDVCRRRAFNFVSRPALAVGTWIKQFHVKGSELLDAAAARAPVFCPSAARGP
jgi:hypothetical protein